MGNTTSTSFEFRRVMSDLLTKPISMDDPLWKTLWETPESAVDIFQNVAPSDVRKLIQKQPDNLHTLISQAVHQMTFFVDQPDHKYHKSALNCVRFLTRIMPFIFETLDDDCVENENDIPSTTTTSNNTESRRNSLHETEIKNNNQFIQDMFWKPPVPSVSPSATTGEKDTTTTPSTTSSTTPSSPSSTSSPTIPCLARRMIASIYHMLFLPDFTIDKERFAAMCRPPPRTKNDTVEGNNTGTSRDGDDDVTASTTSSSSTSSIHYPTANPGHVWEYGVRIPFNPEKGSIDWGGNARLESNRNELLKLLTTCMCRPMYVNPDLHPVYYDRWMVAICQEQHSLQETLLLSLLNMITNYDPIGTGLMSYLPFTSTVMEDPREAHIDACCHALLVLLDYAVSPPDPSSANATASHPSSSGNSSGNTVDVEEKNSSSVPTSVPTSSIPSSSTTSTTSIVPINQYHVHLRAITETIDLNLLFNGITRLLNNIPESNNTYLPNSQKQIKSYQEILIILWQLIDINPIFRTHLITQCDCQQIVLPCLYLMYEYRSFEAMSGLLHLCTFILLHLSGNREFGVALNKSILYKLPVTDTLPLMTSEGNPYGTHVDLCIITFHKMIVDGMRSLQSLYNCMLTILSNISPYIKTLSLISSLKLINLYEIFSSKKFLLSNLYNNQYIFFLLDIFNNIIQYQYNGNHHLIYAMVRRKEQFDKLINLDIDEKEMDKETKTVETTTTTTTTTAATTTATTTAAMGENKDTETVTVQVNAPVIHSNKFVPTKEWLNSWKLKLPLNVILNLLNYLKPKVEQLSVSLNGLINEDDIIKFINDTTMVGVLPQPHPIVVRKYQPNKYTSLWFTTFLWGVVFMRNQNMPLWDGTTIKIFSILDNSSS